eukprot:Tbor_TRINITY_DN1965_c0_g1::TRINITY_DN1965_c0_g1_i1::g.3566::m.3566
MYQDGGDTVRNRRISYCRPESISDTISGYSLKSGNDVYIPTGFEVSGHIMKAIDESTVKQPYDYSKFDKSIMAKKKQEDTKSITNYVEDMLQLQGDLVPRKSKIGGRDMGHPRVLTPLTHSHSRIEFTNSNTRTHRGRRAFKDIRSTKPSEDEIQEAVKFLRSTSPQIKPPFCRRCDADYPSIQSGAPISPRRVREECLAYLRNVATVAVRIETEREQLMAQRKRSNIAALALGHPYVVKKLTRQIEDLWVSAAERKDADEHDVPYATQEFTMPEEEKMRLVKTAILDAKETHFKRIRVPSSPFRSYSSSVVPNAPNPVRAYPNQSVRPRIYPGPILSRSTIPVSPGCRRIARLYGNVEQKFTT